MRELARVAGLYNLFSKEVPPSFIDELHDEETGDCCLNRVAEYFSCMVRPVGCKTAGPLIRFESGRA